MALLTLSFALGCTENHGPPEPKREPSDTITTRNRIAAVYLPTNSDDVEHPLLLVLHGYKLSALEQTRYFHIPQVVHERGLVAVVPDGEIDDAGYRYWNASPACCGVGDRSADDVAYLTELIGEAKARYAIDATRVYVLGHSNGGFMAYRLACDIPGELAAIASLAGAADPARLCAASPTSFRALQIHGTADNLVPYEGGLLFEKSIPSARQSIETLAKRGGCGIESAPAGTLDFESQLPGEETLREQIGKCGHQYELWTILGGAHVPAIAPDTLLSIADWFAIQ